MKRYVILVKLGMGNKVGNEEILINWGLLLVGLYGIFCILLGAYYSYPNAEDLSVMELSMDKGLFGGALELLQTFDGRYTTNILHGMNPLTYGLYYVDKLMPVLAFGLFIGSIFLVFDSVFKKVSAVQKGLYALVFCVLFFSVLDLSQSLFWTAACFVYVYPLIFFLYFFGFFLKYRKEYNSKYYLASILFLFLSLGCSELYLPIVGGTLFLLLIYFKREPKTKKILTWYIAVYLFSSVLFIAAPGSISRFEKYGDERVGDMATWLYGALQYGWQSVNSFANLPFVMFLAVASSHFRGQKNKIRTWTIVGMAAIVICSLWYIVLYLMGDVGFASRIRSVVTPVWVVAIILIVLRHVNRLARFRKLFVVLFFMSFVVVNNSYTLIIDDWRTGRFHTFKQKMDEQYSQLASVSPKNNVCLTLVKLENIDNYIPRSIASQPYIKPNRMEPFWNRAYERYFKIDEVRLKDDTLSVLTIVNEIVNQ